MGYTGGQEKSPTYYSLGNHTEALQVDFDPSHISFEAIARLFWQAHNPTATPRKSQYMSAFWFASDRQLDSLNATKEEMSKQYGKEIQTPLLPLGTFYNAEDYHQKYSLQRHRNLMDAFSKIYPEFNSFIDSTAAARLNGFVSGRGDFSLLEQEIGDYGIPVEEIQSAIRR